MSDRWDFYFHHIGERIASTFVDLGIYAQVPDATRPFLLRVRLHLQLPREDGLFGSEEFEILRRLEDRFSTELKRLAQTAYVGRTTAAGYREFCFYSPQPIARSPIAEALKSFPEYSFDFSSTWDPNWLYYVDVLYPSDEEMQTIKNERVLEALEKHGDSLELPRPVTHWSFFKTHADRQAFLTSTLELGFSIHNLHENGPGDTPFVACLERTDHVDYQAINSVVLELFRLTEDHHGIYDGWETQVTDASDNVEDE